MEDSDRVVGLYGSDESRRCMCRIVSIGAR